MNYCPSEIMSVTMIESSMVVPAKETPKETIWLTDVDLIKRTPFTHTPVVYIYPNSNNNPLPQVNYSTLLKSSLSQLLVTFYPVAGRLSKNNVTGRIEIDCNAKGVLFVEVETSYKVSDFGEFTPNHTLRKLVIPVCDYSGGLANIPLFMVQLTRFECGGVSLGLAANHFVGDGSAYVYMTNEWARLARGVGLNIVPAFDRTTLLVPRNPPQVKFNHLEFQPRPSDSDQYSSNSQQKEEETKVGLFKFSQEQINNLKQQAMSHENKYSTFNVLAAHVWRCALKARGVENDTLVKFSTPVNGRLKFNQVVVPQGYFGNFVFNSAYLDKCGEIVSKPLWYAASKVKETVTRVNEEYIKSAVDFLGLQPDVTALASGPHSSRCPDIHVNYWKGIPFYEADFGWGKPGFVRHGGIGYEGLCFIMQSEYGEVLEVAINLFTSHMERFERIIYDF
ncbi:shikimate O-hydroxycinnamoyltransferase-like [Silene latifolia]|uniref:shikimate O-hydroxycinnamoyltransferase-like n=1 Tax=Silene latifolia TaxID=37657 RepID=UPI003D7852A7